MKVDAEVVRKAKMVASLRGISLAEFISELLKAPVEREVAKEVRLLNAAE